MLKTTKRCSDCGKVKPLNAASHERYVKNKDRYNEARQRWYREHREEIQEYQAKYRETNFQEIQKRRRAYAKTNSAKIVARVAVWRRTNPEKHKANNIRRRGREQTASGTITVIRLKARIEYYGHCCYLCGAPYEAIDHVIPLARGGTSWPANLRPICKSCNSQKGAKPLREVLPVNDDASNVEISL